MNELPAELKALLKTGDPARNVSPQLVSRVARKLEHSAAAPRRPVGALVLGLALLGGVALGSVGTVALTRAVPSLRPAAASRSSSPSEPVSREAAQLERVVTALNRGDAPRALALLEAHQREFPDGPLAIEARVLRARALLQANDVPRALQALQQLPEGDVTPALRVAWVQLLVEDGRCDTARAVAAPLETTQPGLVAQALARCVKDPPP